MPRAARLFLLAGLSWAQSDQVQSPPVPPANPPAQAAPGQDVPTQSPQAQPTIVQMPAQQASIDKNEPEVASHDAPTTFSTRVNLVMVPVVVHDHKGRAIGNLTKGDFQLFDKGKPQTISRFSVENAGEKAANQAARMKAAAEAAGDDLDAIPTRFVAYVFDDIHLNIGDLIHVREAARKHLATLLPPSDRAAIYTTSGTVTLDFTGDHGALDEAMLKIQPRPNATFASMECPPVSYYMADLMQKGDGQANQAAIADAFMCGSLPPPPAGTPAAQAMAQSSASRAIARAEQDNQVTLASLNAILGRMSSAPGQRLLILLSPGFYLTTDFRGSEAGIIDKAIRSNVLISGIDARGLYTVIPGGDASEGRFTNVATASLRNRYQVESASAEGDVLAELADGTGGTWVHNNNDMADGLKQVSSMPEYQYILGFSPQNLRLDGSFHQLRVALKAKDLTLQARRGYYAPKRAADEAEQAKEELREAFFSREELVEVPIAVQTQFFKPTADSAKLSVVAHVDMRQMHFRKAEGRNVNTITIATGLFDRNGNLISGILKTVNLRYKDENLEARLTAGLAAKTSFDVAPGKYVVRLVVRDSEGQTMAARNGVVDIP
jgi:VWFA-related protein